MGERIRGVSEREELLKILSRRCILFTEPW